MGGAESEKTWTTLLLAGHRRDRITHLEVRPARPPSYADWPGWIDPAVLSALRAAGIERPWSHQRAAADLAHSGRHIVVASGTASGKSLAYLLPSLSDITGLRGPKGQRGATALYIAPTKALANDQLGAVRRIGVAGLRAATHDGDSGPEERVWARDHAEYVLTNPDMLHHSLLPRHEDWRSFFGRLRYVVVDECHHYRGVFGAHVALVLRRLRRVAALHDAAPTFVLASATTAEPDTAASRLVGEDVTAVTDDGSPRGRLTLALWEPELTGALGENGAPVRRPATAEAADLLVDLVTAGAGTLTFARSRRGVEAVALTVRADLAEISPDLAGRVAAYRGGYLPEERRDLERALRDGRLLGLVTTNALELGIDVAGLDAVVLAGFPGTRAAMWQQLGRAGRQGADALGVLIARDDPLDTYLVHHPDALLARPVEATVFDPQNPHVLGPHLCAAAAESPLGEDDLDRFGSQARAAVTALADAGHLRRRPGGWYWTHRERASDLADLRGSGGDAVRLVESGTGRVIGTVGRSAAHASAHTGAVYVHQGESWLVDELRLDESTALLMRADPDYTTSARSTTDIAIAREHERRDWGPARLGFGDVRVRQQVTSYLKRRRTSGEVFAEEPLDLPAQDLDTTAVWWTLRPDAVEAALADTDVAGAAHAAEHAAIGLLPLFATCDRWDIGGVSTAMHPDTGALTVFVYDGYAGGAGFAERGFRTATSWLRATRDAISACECSEGCPSCVQSPKCGNQNHPLHKAGAIVLLDLLLKGAS